MAHYITETDSVASVRGPEWHGLAKVWDHYPTVEEAREDILGWEPITEDVYRMVPVISDAGELVETYQKVPKHQAIIRSDNDDCLGIMSDTYTPVLNSEMFDILEALEKESRKDQPLKIETGGSLKGGRKVWLLARLEEPLTVKNDPRGDTVPYYALQNSHDGSGAFRGQAIMTRIVCQNTAHAADLEARNRGLEMVFRHSPSIKERIEEAKFALAGWKESITHFSEMANYLTSVKVTPEEREDFVQAFIPMPVSSEMITDRVRNNIEKARADLRGLFATETLDYIDTNAWGLVQSAVEFSQHVRNTKGRTDRDRMENKFKRSYLDQSELTRNAVKIVKELMSV